ncbi:MAG: DUF423 domain-containing protein [Bacteroidia bacterium]
MQKNWLISGAIFAALAVILGAFAAHALGNKVEEGILTAKQVEAFRTGAQYQLVHAIALILCAIIASQGMSRILIMASRFFAVGILFFSGSLYLLTTAPVTGIYLAKPFGIITPVGGLFFILAWSLLVVHAWKHLKNHQPA